MGYNTTLGSCTKWKLQCREQGEARLPSKDLQTKGHGCFTFKARCDGKRPCGACVRDRHQCREQGELPKPPRKRGQDPQRKCHTCIRNRSRCNGDRPCSTCMTEKLQSRQSSMGNTETTEEIRTRSTDKVWALLS